MRRNNTNRVSKPGARTARISSSALLAPVERTKEYTHLKSENPERQKNAAIKPACEGFVSLGS
jgi:hypothetical protein